MYCTQTVRNIKINNGMSAPTHLSGKIHEFHEGLRSNNVLNKNKKN